MVSGGSSGTIRKKGVVPEELVLASGDFTFAEARPATTNSLKWLFRPLFMDSPIGLMLTNNEIYQNPTPIPLLMQLPLGTINLDHPRGHPS
jgi:hypothetical protein